MGESILLHREKENMTKEEVLQFAAEQKTAFIASVDEEGFPVIRAMMAPRKIEKNKIYFSTNTSSRKIAQYLANEKSCVYFYKRGKFRYRGVAIMGTMQVCTDQPTKNEIWRMGDRLFYKQGVTDPDYCVLAFTCLRAEYYCDFKKETVWFD